MKLKAVILASLLSLVSCSSAPPVRTFADVKEQFAGQIAEQPKRVVVDIIADCREGMCTVSEDTLSKVVRVITKLNDTIESLIDSSNAISSLRS